MSNNKIDVSITKSNGSIIYRIKENSFTASDAFDKTFYEKDKDSYIRIYQSKLMFEHDIEKLNKNYNVFINREYFGFKSIDLIDTALEWICDIHKENNIKWWLVGSAALYIRGINLIPHDLDIMTYLSEINKIKNLVKDVIIEPFHHVTDWATKGFGVIDKNVRIDYAFEPVDNVDLQYGQCDFGNYAEQNLEAFEWHGRKILIPPVHLHIMPNENRNRTERVKMIKDYIRNNS
ncbi:MAG: hypothetical protein KKI09_15205 [Spirochaetes bacterium]|nr:hypothetical protein [Spirochaetota bacterium]MBU0956773.1 hypothetical protein [Spirochaetota bacterium]